MVMVGGVCLYYQRFKELMCRAAAEVNSLGRVIGKALHFGG